MTTMTREEARKRIAEDLGEEILALMVAAFGAPDIDTNLPAYQQRVIAESVELLNRMRALEAFIRDEQRFAQVRQPERMRLCNQLTHMRGYYAVLCQRIEAFGSEA